MTVYDVVVVLYDVVVVVVVLYGVLVTGAVVDYVAAGAVACGVPALLVVVDE